MADTGLALFTYRRPVHTKKVLESIKKNNFGKIYIFQDGPRDEQDKAHWLEVNNIIKSIDYIETELHVSDANKGLANSIIDGVSYVLERHNTVIVLEDDILLGDGFHEYMNECFDRFEDDTRVFSVATCSEPLDIPPDYDYDVFFSYRFSSWGWGTWRNRWKHFSKDYTLLQRILKDKERNTLLNLSGCDLKPMFHMQLDGKIDTWDIFWALIHIDKKAVCVLPTKYLAKNIGFDGSGTHHTKAATIYESDLYSNPDLRFPPEIIVDARIMKEYDNFYKRKYGSELGRSQ